MKHTMAAGADETKLTREALKWPYAEFEIPNEVYDAFGAAGKKGKAIEEEWNKVQTPLTRCLSWTTEQSELLLQVCTRL